MLKKLCVSVIILMSLCACDKTSVPKQPALVAINAIKPATNTEIVFQEICYEGQIYIITSNGGMSPKVLSTGVDNRLRGYNCK